MQHYNICSRSGRPRRCTCSGHDAWRLLVPPHMVLCRVFPCLGLCCGVVDMCLQVLVPTSFPLESVAAFHPLASGVHCAVIHELSSASKRSAMATASQCDAWAVWRTCALFVPPTSTIVLHDGRCPNGFRPSRRSTYRPTPRLAFNWVQVCSSACHAGLDVAYLAQLFADQCLVPHDREQNKGYAADSPQRLLLWYAAHAALMMASYSRWCSQSVCRVAPNTRSVPVAGTCNDSRIGQPHLETRAFDVC